MRSLALVAFLSQFSLQGVTRCALAHQQAPIHRLQKNPSVKTLLRLDLATMLLYAAGEVSLTTDELIVELPTGRQVK